MILEIYTMVHVLISLVGIFSGLVVLIGLLNGNRLDGWTKLFLITTVATSVTGFGFPFHHFTPAHAVGVISLVVLGHCHFRPLSPSPPRCLALDLRDQRDSSPILECLRRRGAEL